MATLGSGLRIPLEVMSMVIANLYQYEHLSSASLVSRAWYTSVFPHLHRVMSVTALSHLATLTSRLESEEIGNSMRISLFLRVLDINSRDMKVNFDSERVQPLVLRFQSALPKLENLEELEWNGFHVPLGVNLFQSLQDSCAKLRWVTVHQHGSWSVSQNKAGTLALVTARNRL